MKTASPIPQGRHRSGPPRGILTLSTTTPASPIAWQRGSWIIAGYVNYQSGSHHPGSGNLQRSVRKCRSVCAPTGRKCSNQGPPGGTHGAGAWRSNVNYNRLPGAQAWCLRPLTAFPTRTDNAGNGRGACRRGDVRILHLAATRKPRWISALVAAAGSSPSTTPSRPNKLRCWSGLGSRT